MFTGIIEQTGRLEKREPRGTGARVTIAHAPWDDDALRVGDSVSVQGACLTVASARPNRFVSDVLDETLLKTCLGNTSSGAVVNLERALRAGDRMGGHIVTGHVDGVGRVARLDRHGNDWALEVAGDAALLRDIVSKGSVALDGVSLTVVDALPESFSVHVIPITWEQTSLSKLMVGQSVNVETDILAKYVRRSLESSIRDPKASVSMDSLRSAGYL